MSEVKTYVLKTCSNKLVISKLIPIKKQECGTAGCFARWLLAQNNARANWLATDASQFRRDSGSPRIAIVLQCGYTVVCVYLF